MDYIDKHPNEITFRNAVTKLSSLAFKLSKTYNFDKEYEYQLLTAIQPPDKPSELTLISYHGTPRRIIGCVAVGSGRTYGTAFIKKCWKEQLTMTQVAEMGFFIIKYIENFELNTTVGVSNGYPQIWFVPDEERNEAGEKIDYEITPDKNETRDRFNTIQDNVTRRLKNHEKHIRKLFS